MTYITKISHQRPITVEASSSDLAALEAAEQFLRGKGHGRYLNGRIRCARVADGRYDVGRSETESIIVRVHQARRRRDRHD